MRRLTGLAIRITASVLLLLTISAWAVTRFQLINIRVKWLDIDLASPGVVVVVRDWDELALWTYQRSVWLDHAYQVFFDHSEPAPNEVTRWFPGGWFSKYGSNFTLVIRHTTLAGYVAMLNVAVFGLWWRRRRKAVPCEG